MRLNQIFLGSMIQYLNAKGLENSTKTKDCFWDMIIWIDCEVQMFTSNLKMVVDINLFYFYYSISGSPYWLVQFDKQWRERFPKQRKVREIGLISKNKNTKTFIFLKCLLQPVDPLAVSQVHHLDKPQRLIVKKMSPWILRIWQDLYPNHHLRSLHQVRKLFRISLCVEKFSINAIELFYELQLMNSFSEFCRIRRGVGKISWNCCFSKFLIILGNNPPIFKI